jgi:hypothetical protein
VAVVNVHCKECVFIVTLPSNRHLLNIYVFPAFWSSWILGFLSHCFWRSTKIVWENFLKIVSLCIYNKSSRGWYVALL